MYLFITIKGIGVIFRRISEGILTFSHNLRIAIPAYNHAIFFIESSPIFSRSYLARISLVSLCIIDFMTASFTINISPPFFSIRALDSLCILDRLIIKLSKHKICSPFEGWLPSRSNPNDSYYVINDKWAGMIVHLTYEHFPEQFDIGSIPLKNQVYSIYFEPENRTIIGTQSFKETIRLAEWYYKEWDKVNSDGTVPDLPGLARSAPSLNLTRDIQINPLGKI